MIAPIAAVAVEPVEYTVSFNNAAHHEAEVSVTYRDIGDAPLQLRMSRTSPGRYAIHEFAKNVYQVKVVDGAGRPLRYSRPNPHQWDIVGHGGTVTATYTLYADGSGGTYSGIDLTHAHLNIPATFMWARGFDDRPITVTLSPASEDWKVATQLVPTADALVFTAPDLRYFMDSPIELSNFSERSWSIESHDKEYALRLAIHHDGWEEDVDAYLDKVKRVIDEQVQVFGELPEFDYGVYTFIADYLPYAIFDGMEHRNSTVLTNSQSLYESEFSQLRTLAHEFVHAWNGERIRPRGLEPFSFEAASVTPSLWFVEGFTSYYGRLTLRRANELSTAEFAEALAEVISAVTYAPGRSFASPQGMSLQASLVDGAEFKDPTNLDNAFISYYAYGMAMALALDLTLRLDFDGLSLDNYMRDVWERHGRTEIAYTDDDLRTALARVTGNADFADEFFSRYIEGQELPDFKALLDGAGMLLRLANAEDASVGPVALVFEGKAALLEQNTIIGSPLYNAGLDRGDQIIALGRLKIRSQDEWDRAIGRFKPGETVTVRYLQRGIPMMSELTFSGDRTLEIVTYEEADMPVSDAQLAFRKGWMSSALEGKE